MTVCTVVVTTSTWVACLVTTTFSVTAPIGDEFTVAVKPVVSTTFSRRSSSARSERDAVGARPELDQPVGAAFVGHGAARPFNQRGLATSTTTPGSTAPEASSCRPQDGGLRPRRHQCQREQSDYEHYPHDWHRGSLWSVPGP